jgi:hypothetical protein
MLSPLTIIVFFLQMDWRLLNDTESSFSALYCCDDSDSLSRVLTFARFFPRCTAAAWWEDTTEIVVFLVFDMAIPVCDCARFYPEMVDASLFYAPSTLCGKPTGFEIYEQQNK